MKATIGGILFYFGAFVVLLGVIGPIFFNMEDALANQAWGLAMMALMRDYV